MAFRITGLNPEPFRPLFGLPGPELRARGVIRHVADEGSGFPDRIQLRDAVRGETVLLLNYVHQAADTPYRASHAIFVREGAEAGYDAVDEIPPALATRLLSLRAFDHDHMMVDAEVVAGREMTEHVVRLLDDPRVAYIHAHYAKFGCYAARITRA